MLKLISFVIPVFNEQDNLIPVYQRILHVYTPLREHYNYELIFVDDGSHDRSWNIIKELIQKDNHIKARKFSRNFGHQIALTAGYDIALGDCIISMDADLQDPPELIISLINAWQEGAAIVYARRTNRNDGLLKKLTAHFYYKIFSRVAEINVPRNVGDFRLIDRKVLLLLQQCREKARYLRGMVAWIGFNHVFVDFNRPNREAGVTGYTWKKMFRLAFDGMTSFSVFPLRCVGYCGLLGLFATFIIFLYIIYNILFFAAHYQLTAWIGLGLFALMSLQSLALWLLGEYLGRVYQQVQGRPLYIIDEELNDQK